MEKARNGTIAGPPLEASGLAKAYGGRVAVVQMDLRLAPGEVVGLLGPNGAGKTTTVKMLLGLSRPDAGTARIFGMDAADPRARRRVGYLPETFSLPGWATGTQVLADHARLAGLSAEQAKADMASVIHRVGLAGREGGRVGGFSKGMRQRLGLAAALLGDPGVVILDEPTSALDPIGRREVRDIVLDLREQGVAVLLNSHLLGEVEQVCDRVVVMDRGRVLTDRPVSSLPGGGEVRITLDRMTEEFSVVIGGFGTIGHHDTGSAVVTLDDDAAGPDMVAALVSAGARVRAVVPLRSSLEELFVRLVQEANPGTTAPREWS